MSNNVREIYERLLEVSHDIPMSEYNETRSINLTSGNLKTIRDETPADYKEKMDNPKPFDSHATRIGRITHTLTLELDKFEEEYVVATDEPINDNTGKPFGSDSKTYLKWARQKQVAGQTLISVADYNLSVTLKDAIYANSKMAHIFSEGIAERTLFADYCEVACQVRPDFVSPVYGALDLKKCASLKWFLNDAKYKYKYMHQAAFYRAVIRQALGHDFGDLPYLLCVVEEKRPYKTAIYQLDTELLDFCEKQNGTAIKTLKECQDTGEWPTTTEGIEFVFEM